MKTEIVTYKKALTKCATVINDLRGHVRRNVNDGNQVLDEFGSYDEIAFQYGFERNTETKRTPD